MKTARLNNALWSATLHSLLARDSASAMEGLRKLRTGPKGRGGDVYPVLPGLSPACTLLVQEWNLVCTDGRGWA